MLRFRVFLYRLAGCIRILFGKTPMTFGAWKFFASRHMQSFFATLLYYKHTDPTFIPRLRAAFADDNLPLGRSYTLARITQEITGFGTEENQLEVLPAVGGDKDAS